MKTVIVAVCVFLLNGCPFLPPSMFQHVGYGVYPNSTISLPIGESMSDEENPSVPGFFDIVGVTSELKEETLYATLYLRDLPDDLQWNQALGHMQDFQTQWIVMVEIEGDSSTPFEWHDYILKANYYDPVKSRINQGKRLPDYPWVMIAMRKCEPAIHEDIGEYNSCVLVEESVEFRFSHEDNSITLLADYGEPQSLDHETGKIRCIRTYVCRHQSTKCSSAGVR